MKLHKVINARIIVEVEKGVVAGIYSKDRSRFSKKARAAQLNPLSEKRANIVDHYWIAYNTQLRKNR